MIYHIGKDVKKSNQDIMACMDLEDGQALEIESRWMKNRLKRFQRLSPLELLMLIVFSPLAVLLMAGFVLLKGFTIFSEAIDQIAND